MLPEEEPLDELARRAGQGDKEALEGICRQTAPSAYRRRPDPAGTLERAARQLDLAEAIAELYRSDPGFLAPEGVWEALRKAAPDLIGSERRRSSQSR